MESVCIKAEFLRWRVRPVQLLKVLLKVYNKHSTEWGVEAIPKVLQLLIIACSPPDQLRHRLVQITPITRKTLPKTHVATYFGKSFLAHSRGDQINRGSFEIMRLTTVCIWIKCDRSLKIRRQSWKVVKTNGFRGCVFQETNDKVKSKKHHCLVHF